MSTAAPDALATLAKRARAFSRTRQRVTFDPTAEPPSEADQRRRLQAHEAATKALVEAAVAYAQAEMKEPA